MEFLKKKQTTEDTEKLHMIPVEEIYPNPNQPRKVFHKEEIESLALSIKELGILQPLTVRKGKIKWELIAGERRWRAAQKVGLPSVPCIVKEVSEETSSLLALVENIQRQDLDYMEEANALANLISTYGLSQEEVSKKIGKSQSAVANTLRLLRLPDIVVEKLRQHHCTQRHARALLKIPQESLQLEILEKVANQSLNVAQTESLIESYLSPSVEKSKSKKLILVRDVRLFLNTVTKSLNMMQASGVEAKCKQEETEQEILLTITIPRQGSKMKNMKD